MLLEELALISEPGKEIIIHEMHRSLREVLS